MNTQLFSRSFGALALVTSLALVGCNNDPAKDKTKVTTTEAQPTTQSAAADTAAAKTYVFDDETGSKLSWVGAKVTGKHDGGFKNFQGTVKVPGGAVEKGSVEVNIDTTSIFSDTEKLTKHLSSADFFDVQKYPKASFVSTKVEKGGEKGATHTVTGNLTIRGVTKGVSFPATIKAEGDTVTVDAEFAINRKEFGIVYAGMPDDLIKDDVLIKLAIRANAAKS